MPIDQLPQGNRHLLLNGTGVVDMPRDAKEFSASVVWPSEG